jgi:hypothetical protein
MRQHLRRLARLIAAGRSGRASQLDRSGRVPLDRALDVGQEQAVITELFDRHARTIAEPHPAIKRGVTPSRSDGHD